MEDKHPLQSVFDAAILQATHGKGTRHGGATTPFLKQPWVHYAKMHGTGFLTGQAVKKLEESLTKPTVEQTIQEMLGAIVYMGMAVLQLNEGINGIQAQEAAHSIKIEALV